MTKRNKIFLKIQTFLDFLDFLKNPKILDHSWMVKEVVAKIPQTYVFLLVQRASSLLLQRVFHTRASHPACMSRSF